MRGALPPTATELGRISDRLSFLYVEHARIDRDQNAVTFHTAEGTVHVPAAMLAALLAGPGTRVTHAAVSLLAGAGCSVLWTGEDGVRLYAGAVTAATSSRLLIRQAFLASDPARRAEVARAMYAMRFPGEDVSGLPVEQLRGREGTRVRACYRFEAQRTGIAWTGRKYDPGKWTAADPVNRALSAANSCLYGIVHAAILHLGCSAGLGFVHAGHQLSFAYDIADLYKAQVTIPAAFDTVAEAADLSASPRRRVRDRIIAGKLLERAVSDIRLLLGAGPAEDLTATRPELWDGDAAIPGGTSYGDSR